MGGWERLSTRERREFWTGRRWNYAEQKGAQAAKEAFVHFFGFAPPLGRSPMVTLPLYSGVSS